MSLSCKAMYTYILIGVFTFQAEVFEIIDAGSVDKLNVLSHGSSVGIAQVTLQRDIVVFYGSAREAML